MDKTEKTNHNQSAAPKDSTAKPKPPSGEDSILADAEYQQLLIEYQNARWEECRKLLENLLKKYPNHPRLAEFKRDFEFQYSFHQNSEVSVKKARKDQAQTTRRKGLIIVAGILVVLLFIWGGYTLLSNITSAQQHDYAQAQIELLSGQVESLLNSGQPEKAQELVQQMQSLDASNEKVIELSTQTTELLAMNQLYEDALVKISDGADADALVLLQKIDAEVPGYRDVKQLITQTQNKIEVKQVTEEATLAYKENRWEDAITGFEKAYSLDPELKDANMKEQLLNSYLHRIIQMLESNDSTIEDIEKAELYYRRAIAMIPQSRVYATERENLQKISSSLLEMKYTQTASALISDPNQTLNSINRAVNYLSKASNLNPANTQLKSEVEKITMYQVGMQDYVEMNWAPAIDQLTKLNSLDSKYAGGLAAQLLYEAHVGRGNQYFAVGLYLDARKEYEAAETIAWDNGENQMQLFLVEVDLGYTLGRLKDYQNAASYFKYAVETINYTYRASGDPGLILDLANAIQNYNDGLYQASYDGFVSALEKKSSLFSEKEINAQVGTLLAFVAGANQSSVSAISERNKLTRMTVVTADQVLVIPYLP